MKMLCYWNGEKELAREVEIDDERTNDAALGDAAYVKADNYWIRIPNRWLHPIEPTIPKGKLVYAWNGDVRMKRDWMGYYEGKTATGVCHLVNIRLPGYEAKLVEVDHVEPVSKPIDWSKLSEVYREVVECDSGIMIPRGLATAEKIGDLCRWGTVVAIHKRPKS